MKKAVFLLIISVIVLLVACKKENESEKFTLLTAHLWTSDSLLAEGIDASGAGQMLEKFKGDALFRKDGTGYFGKYTGTWEFVYEETSLKISSDSLQFPITANVRELTTSSLKITTSYPNPLNLSNPYDIRMTFKAK